MYGVIISAISVIFGSFFQVLVNFFIKYLTKKLAFGAVATALFLAFTAAFIAALNYLLSSIYVAFPPIMSVAVSWFVPGNASSCLSAYLAALLARFIYDTKTKVIQYTLF